MKNCLHLSRLQPTRSAFSGALLVLSGWLIVQPDSAAIGASAASSRRKLLGQIGLQNILGNRSVRFLGFTAHNEAMLIAEKEYLSNIGDIVKWNVARHKVKAKIPLSRWISSFNLSLSADGKWLVSNNNASDLSFRDPRAFRITIMRTEDFKVVTTKNLKEREESVGFLPLPGDNRHIIAQMLSLIPYQGDFTFGKDRLAWLNLRTGKIDKVLPYEPARECDGLLAAPGGRFLAGLFHSANFFDSEAEAGELDDEGFVDIIDARSGKIRWHLAATGKQPIGEPLFFISPTRFISAGTVFDIKTKTAHPWSAVTASRRCLAGVPGHSNFALFQTKAGLQLRDWTKNRVVETWPTLKQPGRILFSPDLKMFSYGRNQAIQFWRFDPKWLRGCSQPQPQPPSQRQHPPRT